MDTCSVPKQEPTASILVTLVFVYEPVFLGSGLCVDRLNSDDPQIARELDFPDGNRLGYSYTLTAVLR